MTRVLALDVGEKMIGVAISDESCTFAFPIEAIRRQEGYRRDMAALRALVEKWHIGEIVVGWPLRMNGSRGIQAQKVEEFVQTLRKFVQVPIHLQDERLSTREAEKVLQSAGCNRKVREEALDSMAASVILQSYLDQKRRSTESS